MRKLPVADAVVAQTPRIPRSPGDRARGFQNPDPHLLEQAVQRRLLSHPDLRFASLVIRRIPNGVCLEGVLEEDGDLDVCKVVRSIDGVGAVLNHLVIHRPANVD